MGYVVGYGSVLPGVLGIEVPGWRTVKGEATGVAVRPGRPPEAPFAPGVGGIEGQFICPNGEDCTVPCQGFGVKDDEVENGEGCKGRDPGLDPEGSVCPEPASPYPGLEGGDQVVEGCG